MKQKWIIRIMTSEDYEKVYALWKRSSGMGLRPVDDAEPGIRRFLERNSRTCFVADHEGILVGAILSGHDGRRAYIYHTAVEEAYQRQGLGRDLVSAVEQALRNEGITKIGLVVFKRNEGGNRFWEKQGFSVRDDLVYRNKLIT
ncbi:MAG: GNAT family N-acetyltransferase [Treponema sp.]|jgi:ribosomal protein S18 acetylase RimI-like enzyme|nr:GNAT family N-acetyltransferase [Treponema sp.]